nr:hypothetical protein [Tanacetum cinerariifolium]
EDDGNGKEDQGLRISDEQRQIEEEEEDELYRDVNINQGWGLQVSQDIEDSHTNQFAEAVSKIPGIVHQYMTQQMTEAVREPPEWFSQPRKPLTSDCDWNKTLPAI